MKILFLKDVGGVGQRGTIKDVADGYALNLLIPQGAAVQATPERIAAHNKAEAANKEAQESHDKAIAEELRKINGKTITIEAAANEHGRLFKSIKREDIAKALNAQGAKISPDMIDYKETFREAGTYQIRIKSAGSEAGVTLIVKGK